MINKDKLTPYDVQILTLVALAPGAYEVLFPGLAHTDAVIDEIVEAAGRAALRIAATH